MKIIGVVELEPDDLVEMLKEKRAEIDKIRKDINDALLKAPEGSLRIQKKGKYIQYYSRNDPSDTEGIYLKRAQDPLAAALAQKDYDSRLLDELRQESLAIGRFLVDYHPERIDEIFQSLHEHRKPLVNPVRFPDEDYIRRWMSVEYEKKAFDVNTPEFYTARGERVRSKSEIMIADALNRHGIPYRYEYPIHLSGLGTVHPDFICLNVRLHKEIVWEHYGLISNSDYADNAVNKIEKYFQIGIYPGENSVMTFETRSCPLNSRIIESKIRKYLL